MKDRIVFFILGAVLATMAYAVGNASKADADRLGRYGLLVADALIVKKILISESGLSNVDDNSMIGMSIDDNVPNIMITNRKNGIEQSAVVLSAFTGSGEHGTRPTILLVSDALNEKLAITSKRVIQE